MTESRWDVIVNGGTIQGGERFEDAVRRAAYAHQRGDTWDVRVDNRYLSPHESHMFVASVLDRVMVLDGEMSKS